MTSSFTTRSVAAFTLAPGIAALGACASTPGKEDTGEYVDDTVITTGAKSAVLDEPTLKSAEIELETFKGRVQLSGFVGSQGEIDKAVAVAREVEGVSSVANDMRIQ